MSLTEYKLKSLKDKHNEETVVEKVEKKEVKKKK